MNIREMSKEDVLRVYDPTLDMDAQPEPLDDDDVEPVPDEWEVDRVKPNDGPIIVSSTHDPVTGEWTDTKVSAKDIRVALDGRLIRGAFDASKRGGWVRFLAMREGAPYSHRHINPKSPGGAVTGIAFGTVEWFVKKGVVPSTVSA